jgi:hypothetical protein
MLIQSRSCGAKARYRITQPGGVRSALRQQPNSAVSACCCAGGGCSPTVFRSSSARAPSISSWSCWRADGLLVTKEELLNWVWPGIVVSEENLTLGSLCLWSALYWRPVLLVLSRGRPRDIPAAGAWGGQPATRTPAPEPAQCCDELGLPIDLCHDDIVDIGVRRDGRRLRPSRVCDRPAVGMVVSLPTFSPAATAALVALAFYRRCLSHLALHSRDIVSWRLSFALAAPLAGASFCRPRVSAI